MHSINQRQQPAFVQPWETPTFYGQPLDPMAVAQEEERRRRLEQGIREVAGIVIGAAAVIGAAVLLGRALR